MSSKILNVIKNPYKLIVHLNNTSFTRFIPDVLCLKCIYRDQTGKRLDLKNPKGFNEKLQWLKLYNHQPQYNNLVDKFEAKNFVAGIIGEDYIIPSLGVWEDIEDVDISKLPEQFVLKTTHDSKGVVICKDRNTFNWEAAKEKLKKHLNKNFYYGGREWPYKDVKPRIIAEEYKEDKVTGELRDYKFFCFNGQPKVLYIAQGRGIGNEVVADFFDMEFNHLDLKIDHEMATSIPEKPYNFDLMKQLASRLSSGLPHVRVDFYEANGNVFFGELTFFHCSGFANFHPDKWDKTFGDWIILPKKKR